jgi:hypothetical protein
MDKHQQNEAHGKPNSPKQGVNPNANNHRAAGFKQQRQIFDCGQQRELELGE